MNFDTILGIITHPALVGVITVIGGIAIKGFVKYKAAYKAFNDIPRAIVGARKSTSPGGTKITSDEYALIGKEVMEFIQAGAAAYVANKKQK